MNDIVKTFKASIHSDLNIENVGVPEFDTSKLNQQSKAFPDA